MTRRVCLVAGVLMGVLVGGASYGELDFLVNARPASVLMDASGGKFSAEGPEGRVNVSHVYAMPNVSLGVGWEIDDFYLDLTGGGGVLFNDSFRSFMLDASIALNYAAATESMMFGPRLGIVYYPNPEWLDNNTFDFDEAWGYLLGLQLTMGDKIQYLVEVDLLSTSFDATPDANVTGDDKLEIGGILFQFGVRGEF